MINSLVKNISKIRFFRYSLGGVLSYLINIVVTYLLTTIFHIYYFYSYLIAYSIVVLFNFTFSLKIIFSVNGNIANRFIRYIIFLTIFSLINIFSVKFLTESMNLYYIISISIVTIVLFIIKYFIYKKFVFDSKQDILI